MTASASTALLCATEPRCKVLVFAGNAASWRFMISPLAVIGK